MIQRPFASAADRNATPILEVLRREFQECARVLEIGSGTGQHAVTFAAELRHLTWQTSDLGPNHDGIRQWIRESGVGNVLEPVELDVLKSGNQPGTYDAVYSSNTAHIMSYDAVCRMIELVGEVLHAAGVFGLYGPFRVHGRFTTASNEAFDESLRSRNPLMGLRELDDLEDLGERSDLVLSRVYAMPANNLMTIWHKSGGDS